MKSSRHGGSELSFFSITAVIGTPLDVTVDELAIESLCPADQATAAALHELPPAVGSTTAHQS